MIDVFWVELLSLLYCCVTLFFNIVIQWLKKPLLCNTMQHCYVTLFSL
jgi:hypothetical protein